MLYEIVIRGCIGDAWFEEMKVTQQKDNLTSLRGRLTDQAALYGILRRISDLGIELISVNRLPESDRAQETRI